jgi:hypothetical protein
MRHITDKLGLVPIGTRVIYEGKNATLRQRDGVFDTIEQSGVILRVPATQVQINVELGIALPLLMGLSTHLLIHYPDKCWPAGEKGLGFQWKKQPFGWQLHHGEKLSYFSFPNFVRKPCWFELPELPREPIHPLDALHIVLCHLEAK